MKVAVAMSGGVDSSVAAALLRQRGHEVIGLTMRFIDQDPVPAAGGRGCCGLAAIKDAARVAARLDIAHYPLDFRQVFEQEIIEDFCSEYRAGRTPNPCLRCNERVKFRALLTRARELGCSRLATGHYAQVTPNADGLWELRRAQDPDKDQTYFLYTLTQEQLAGALMPLGEYTKTEVRAIARELELPVADRPESQEICFIPDNDYGRFLEARHPEIFCPGPVLDTQGREIGQHQGIARFTIGQRKGLGIAFGDRRYVVRIDPGRNAVVLGTESEVYRREATVEDVRWISGRPPAPGAEVLAKVRYQHPGGAATIESTGPDSVRVEFREPQWAITPGQAMVFYQGDLVLGGGTIS